MCVSIKEKERIITNFKKRRDEKIEHKQSTVSEEFFKVEERKEEINKPEDYLNYILNKYGLDELMKKPNEGLLR